MRHAAYLSPSRHGTFYFRWPIPTNFHPTVIRTDEKASFGRRCRRLAKSISRRLFRSEQSLCTQTSLIAIRYEEIRKHIIEHCQEQLQKFRGVAVDGPLGELDLSALRASQVSAEADLAHWLAHKMRTVKTASYSISVISGIFVKTCQRLINHLRDRITFEPIFFPF